jgi:tRNA threonylcarbamoyladenosine biosynthesis protein TsaB
LSGADASFERILAIDASGAACSAALWHRGVVIARRHRRMMRGHAEALMPMIVETMTEADESFRRLDAVAVTVGPGAFTGIRIGLAAARGIALAAGIPAVGVTTFAAVAESVPESERGNRRLIVLLDSKRGDVFVQEFAASLRPARPPEIRAPAPFADALAERTVLAGDGVALVRPHLTGAKRDVEFSSADGPADAAHVAAAAVRLSASGEALPARPMYLRAPDVRPADREASVADKIGCRRP